MAGLSRAPFARPLALGLLLGLTACQPGADRIRIEVDLPEGMAEAPLDGRLLVVLSQREEGEPRFHVTDGVGA